MSHNINKENVFVVGKPAWHRLGKVLDNPATAEEALKYAGLGFEVEKWPLITTGGTEENPIILPVARRFSTVRTDTNQVLGVVGSKYSVLQNTDAFSFFDPVVDEKEAVYHSAGVLGQGEKIWIMAKLPEHISIQGFDDIEVYVTIMSSHDGNGLKAFIHLHRIVCENTLQFAMGAAKRLINIRHTGDVVAKVQEAHKLLGISNQYAAEVSDIFDKMATVRVDPKLTKYFVEALFPLPDKEVMDKLERTPANVKYRTEVAEAIEAAPGQELKTAAGTAFGLYNGVTWWLDHHKSYSNDTTRLSSLWYGNSSAIRQAAYEMASSFN